MCERNFRGFINFVETIRIIFNSDADHLSLLVKPRIPWLKLAYVESNCLSDMRWRISHDECSFRIHFRISHFTNGGEVALFQLIIVIMRRYYNAEWDEFRSCRCHIATIKHSFEVFRVMYLSQEYFSIAVIQYAEDAIRCVQTQADS